MNRGLANVYRAQIGGQSNGAAGTIAGANSEFGVDVGQSMYGLETALARGPLKLQGGWVRSKYDAVNPLTLSETVKGDVDVYYIQAMWNITGEKWSEMYRGGVFRGVTPNNNFRLGSGWGAWQLGLRWSAFDSSLNATGAASRIQSGTGATGPPAVPAKMNSRVNSYGIGVNWILNPMSRVMFEWTRTDFGGNTLPLDIAAPAGSMGIKQEDVFSIRTQVMF